MPGVRRACERYMEPNLPAPISTTRTGRFRRRGRASRRWRFIRYGHRARRTDLAVYRPGRGKMRRWATIDTATRAGLRPRGSQALAPALDVLGLPACVLDPELRYRYVNAAYARHVRPRRAPSSSAAPPTRSSSALRATTAAATCSARSPGETRRLQPPHARGPGRRALGARALLPAARRRRRGRSACWWCWWTSSS